MDPRRLLILTAAGLHLGGCAGLPDLRFAGWRPTVPAGGAEAAGGAAADPPPPMGPSSPAPEAMAPPPPRTFATMAPIPNPAPGSREGEGARAAPSRRPALASGPQAIAAANARAREVSHQGAFVGGVQVFAYAPGRVYEVWTAPLRVTTLTLSPGETVVSKAAGDTVRWQIGETASGEGAGRRAHVMIKPLERGLETNLALATDRRLYLLQLRSGAADAFNAAVAWDLGAVLAPPEPPPAAQGLESPPAAAPPGLAGPAGPLDAGYRIAPKGRPPSWTPRAVMTDGVRTYLAFAPSLAAGEAPALFAVGPGGEARLVNYRQRGDLWVVDQVLAAAELRLGGRRAQVVRIERLGAGS